MRSVSALLAVACVMVACGGSSSSSDGNGNGTPSGNGDAGTAQPPAGGDGGTSNADAGVAADAAPPDDPGSDTYPADHPPMPLMDNFGGDVLADMKVVTVTFVGNTTRDDLRKFDDAVVADDWWAAVTRGYGINKGTSGGYAELEDTVSGKTIDNDKDLKPWIQQMVTDGKLPAPDKNTLYALYYPSSTTITLVDGAGPGQNATSCQTFGGYHDSASVKLADNSTVEAAFAVLPDCGGGLQAAQATASHEFIEAATDPHPQTKPTYYMWDDAWSPQGVLGGEVADQCEGRGTLTSSDGFEVSKSWVNAAAKESKDPCQPGDPGKVFFGLAIQTEKQTYTDKTDPTNTHDSFGYITIKAGETKTIDTVVFSEAKLPHPLTLVVGARARGTTDPTQVKVIATGVTAQLDHTTGTNGQHRKLTITAAPGTAAGDHPFVVRAVLEQTDYHSWPVILRITQ